MAKAPYAKLAGRYDLLRRPALILGAAVLLCAALTGLASLLWDYGHDGPITNPTDFRAFYCAGAALNAGADPYHVEPLRTCQRDVLASAGLQLDPRKFLPAPLPPYALAFFALFARLPYRLATELWFGLGIVALCVAIVAVQRLSGLRALVVAAAFVFSLGFASLAYGQVVPFVVAALAVAALAARRVPESRGELIAQRTIIGVCAAVAALEPHLALPAWLGLALFVRPARLPLIIAGVALAAISIVSGLAPEYFTEVLPLHARAELVNFGGQYSLSALLYAFGAPARISLWAGSISYVCMLALGVWLAAQLQRRYQDPAFAVVTPLAAVLLGGAFMHNHQLAAALPLGLMLVGQTDARSVTRTLAVTAVVALAIPWQTIAEIPAVAAVLPHKAVTGPEPVVPTAYVDGPAEIPYIEYMNAFAERDDPRTRVEQLLWKLPAWGGLVLILCAAAVSRRGAGSVARAKSDTAHLEGREAVGI